MVVKVEFISVIMSDTPHGLQTILNELYVHVHVYSEKWKLTINTAKTKIMVFRKGGRLPPDMKFYYNKELDIVNRFVYLGLVFTCRGVYTNAQKTLGEQGRKPVFKLMKYIHSFVYLGPSHCLELFDKLVKPVLMYCAGFP